MTLIRAKCYAGKRAYYLEGREPVGVSVIQPIKSGNVSNYDLACQMVEYFMNGSLKRIYLNRE
ncbi:MAG: hypothetical protein ACLR6O_00080 [Eubacterium sp.]